MSLPTTQLADDFNKGSSIDASKWTAYGSNASQSGGYFRVATTLGSSYSGINSVLTNYDLTGTYVSILVVDAGNQALTSLEAFPIQLQADSNNKVQWRINGGNIMARTTVAASSVDHNSTTYNSYTHKWLRIRESGGTTYWEYSSDYITWNVLYSVANPITLTSLTYDIGGGTFATEVSTTTLIYDDLNVGQSSQTHFYTVQGFQ